MTRDTCAVVDDCCHVWGEWSAPYSRLDHLWVRRRCIYCGAVQEMPASEGFLTQQPEPANPLDPLFVPLLMAITRQLDHIVKWLHDRER